MNPRELDISLYTYDLPEDRIARFPLSQRDNSRLLVYDGAVREDVFKNLAHFLPAGAFAVFNDTRVVEARLLFRKPTGSAIEVFCLEPDNRYPDITTALAAHGEVYWKCMVGNAASWNKTLVLEKNIEDDTLHAEMVSKQTGHFIIHLSWNNKQRSFAEIVRLAGVVPLPPYIKREPGVEDNERYQTIYAHCPGSVAAPTAGLHFTPHVIDSLRTKNIDINYVTLHVGAGTFKPVKSTLVGGHDMHSEFIEVNISFLHALLKKLDSPIVAVGTTSLRTLESLYWIGVKLMREPDTKNGLLHVGQWEPYDSENINIAAADALNAIVVWLEKNRTHLLLAKTSILIAPSYQFKIVSVLITNFHQPGSTLLLLVAAFIGEKWKTIYTYALENNFRFLSYGDCCLFFRQ